jgi:hypothetical protein
MAIILKQIEDEQPSLLPVPIPGLHPAFDALRRPVKPESAITNAKLAKLAKLLDVCDAFDAPSPAKLRRIASKGGSYMYSTHSDPPFVGSEQPINSKVEKQLRRQRSRTLWKKGLLKVRASVRIAEGAERVAQSHTGLSLAFDDMDLVLGSSIEPVEEPKKVVAKKVLAGGKAKKFTPLSAWKE